MSTPSTPVASLPTPPGPRYHPDFINASIGMDTDVTLVGRDGTHFRINAIFLKSASSFFNTLLTIPQPAGTGAQEPVLDSASLSEESEVLEDILRIISGKEIDPDRLVSLNALEPLLLAAEKWDMLGVLSIMRALLRSNPSSDPIRVYMLGTLFEWEDVASVASKYSCSDDFTRVHNQSLLARIDGAALRRLKDFHNVRRARMRAHLLGGNIISSSHSRECVSRTTGSTTYHHFAEAVIRQMGHTPPARKIPYVELLRMATETEFATDQCHLSCNVSERPSSDSFKSIHWFWNLLPQQMTA